MRAGEEHYSPVGGEEDGGIYLCDAFGADADVASDGLSGGVGTCG